MLPASTGSPPNFFTPSRWPGESRPLREEPPDFLWAIGSSSASALAARRGLAHRRGAGNLLGRLRGAGLGDVLHTRALGPRLLRRGLLARLGRLGGSLRRDRLGDLDHLGLAPRGLALALRLDDRLDFDLWWDLRRDPRCEPFGRRAGEIAGAQGELGERSQVDLAVPGLALAVRR